MKKARHQPKRKGTRAERQLQEFMDSYNIPNLRTAGSGSRRTAFCDVVTWRRPPPGAGSGEAKTPLQTVLAEVKYRSSLTPRIYIRDDLVETAEKVGASWIIAVRMKGCGFYIYDREMWLVDGRPSSFLVERSRGFKTLSGYFDTGQASQPAAPPEEEIKVPKEQKEPVGSQSMHTLTRRGEETKDDPREYEYGTRTRSRRILEEAIAKTGLIDTRILKEAQTALTEETTRQANEIARTAGRLMRQDLRRTILERDIRNAVKIIERKRLPVAK